MKKKREKRENLGARVAKNVKLTVEGLTSNIRRDDEASLALDLSSFVHDMMASGMDKEVKEEFFDEISKLLPGKECLKLETALNKASAMMDQAVIWRVLTRADRMVGVTKEEKNSPEVTVVTVLDSSLKETLSTARKGRRGRPAVNNTGSKADYTLPSFYRELECHSQWFGQSDYTKQQKLTGELLKDIKGERVEDSVKKSIIHLLPLLWRGGLLPEKGLDVPQLIFFALKETFEKEEAEELVESADRHLINQLASEITLKDKLGENVLWLVRSEMQEELETLDLSELGLVVIGHQRGKFRGALQSVVEKLIEQVEKVLPEALVRRLFLKENEEKKTE